MPNPITEQEFWRRARRDANGCLVWIRRLDQNGYAPIFRRGRWTKAHRLAWEFSNGKVPSGMNVCHRCDNRACIEPTHLFVGTQSDNMRDCENKGRANHPVGERNNKAKLTSEEVLELRRRRAAGESMYRLGKVFGIARQSVRSIILGRHWRHVQEAA